MSSGSRLECDALPTPDRLRQLTGRMAGRPVVLVADLVVDRFVVGRPQRVSREAPVLILEQIEERIVPGGGGNAATNVRALGGHPLVIGAVGRDHSGNRLLERFESLGIDRQGVVRRPGATPTKTRILGGGPTTFKQQVVRVDSGGLEPPDEAGARELEARLAAALRNGTKGGERPGVLVASDYGYGALSGFRGDRLRSLSGPETLILVDSRYRLGEFSGVDGATPNQEEAEALAGRPLDRDEDLQEAGSELRRRLGLRFLLITRGSRGMALFLRRRPPLTIPIHGTDQVADVTGAGDTVIGTLSLALAAGATILEAAVLANYAGGVVVLKEGTATLSGDELEAAISADEGLLGRLRWAGS